MKTTIKKLLAVPFFAGVVLLSHCTPGECNRYKEAACKNAGSEACRKAKEEYKDMEADQCMQRLAEVDTSSGMDKLDQFFNEE